MLKLNKITKIYQQGASIITPLNEFSLEIKSGEIVALVGPSGSGKTTVLQIAGLLDNPTSGEVFIIGEELSKANDEIKTRARKNTIGFVYQFHHLLPEFSALENIVIPQIIAGITYEIAKNNSLQLLAQLGLENRASHRPAKLSGGECQRVAIARALANNPKILIADEPTGNLDYQTSEQVFSLLLKQVKQRKIAAIIATHNMELAGKMDRVVRI